jgi:hypothetical protein
MTRNLPSRFVGHVAAKNPADLPPSSPQKARRRIVGVFAGQDYSPRDLLFVCFFPNDALHYFDPGINVTLINYDWSGNDVIEG